VRVGLVGAGTIAREHLACLLQLPDVRVVGVADPAIDAAIELAERAGARAVPDFRSLLGEIDAAWICTPTFLHPEQTIACAEAGVHVFCEKPIALDVPSADRIIAAARRSNVRLMIGHIIRYYPETIALKALVDGGELGDPIYIFGRRLMPWGAALMVGWRRDVALSGGTTMDSGIHEVDTVRWLGGEIASVQARVIYGDPVSPGLDTDFRALFKLQNGTTGAVDLSLHSATRDWSWGVVGTRATATTPRRGEVHLTPFGAIDPTIVPVEPIQDPDRQLNRAMLAEDRAFVEAIRAGQPAPIPGEEGRRNLEIVLAALRASREERVIVTLPDNQNS
jgi:myo-inositol 2-dehydrogenase/D-chiro-inositol 1-dehydrogenase